MSPHPTKKKSIPVTAEDDARLSVMEQKWRSITPHSTIGPMVRRSIIIISHSSAFTASDLQKVLGRTAPPAVVDATITLVSGKDSTPESVKYCKVNDEQREKVLESTKLQKVLVTIDGTLRYVWR